MRRLMANSESPLTDSHTIVSFGLCWPPDKSLFRISRVKKNELFGHILVAISQSLSCVWLFDTPGTATHHTTLSFTTCQSLPKFMSIESVILSCHHILCYPLLFLPSIILRIRDFSIESALHTRWPENWSFSLSISPSTEYSGLISFRIGWFDLLADQGTCKSLFQHHNLKESILWCSAFFMVQISHPYMTTGKTTALTIWTFVSKVASLLFNTLSRFVIAFLPRSKHLLISWLKSLSAVILEPKNRKSVTVSTFSSSCHEMMELDDMIFFFLNVEF